MDGVLCTNRACEATGNVGMGFSYLDPIACLIVKRLCEDYDARIVISSSWRLDFSKEAMEAILSANCPNLGNYIYRSNIWWRTSTHSYTNCTDALTMTTDRGREIKQWVDNHEGKMTNFVILDDMADMRPVQDHLVKCDCYDGLGWHQWQAAKKILSTPI